MLLFMVAVAVMDGWRAITREWQGITASFGHDTNIYPDHSS
jgi:hypothetical protein